MGEPRTLPVQKTTRFAPRSIGSESSFAREVAVLSMISRLNRIPCSVAFFSSSSKSSSGETHCDCTKKASVSCIAMCGTTAWSTVTSFGLNSQGRGKTSLPRTSMGKQGRGIWVPRPEALPSGVATGSWGTPR